ncbi:3-isopropylmalate dehydratase large subunit [Variovorax sp. KK3]|uniref:3-isopropylmalate dehydratase large subunit n=1 Tax=Variovorax sp. KK3 TaxID=1855728 RepID=UPI00097C0812|nr:3-isopropylmalate dehydratase large subunit [Variovorax sp. KK3]
MTAKTLFSKLWDTHVVQSFEDDWALLHIDRHLMHDLGGAPGLIELGRRALPVRNPELVYATPDHVVSSEAGRTGQSFPGGAALYAGLKARTKASGIRFFDLGQPGHGIVHVMAPELGIVQPGLTVVCGDSHTCTNGALGAMAFGIGSSELAHVLASQTLLQRRPRTMRVWLHGTAGANVTAKDIALFMVSTLGAGAAAGHAVEYAGPVVAAFGLEERMTLCNMSIEMGARIGMVAPDRKTVDYLAQTELAPRGVAFDQAAEAWMALRSDDDARFDKDVSLDVSGIGPMITWGTSPDQAMGIGECVPSGTLADADAYGAIDKACRYMGLAMGQRLHGTRIDRVFIGSCTNSRISDLRDAARLIRGRKVAPHVQAWVVAGSENVKRQAEREGLADVFRAAGFDWREPGCSMCVAANGEVGSPGERVVSTSNRNFVGRQGPGVRTHLASPATAVASALAGCVASAGDLA